MAIETTPLGFQKPDGNDRIRNGDDVISANAQTANDRLSEDRARLAQLEKAAGFPGTGLDIADTVVAPLINGATQTRANLDALYGVRASNLALAPDGIPYILSGANDVIVYQGNDGRYYFTTK